MVFDGCGCSVSLSAERVAVGEKKTASRGGLVFECFVVLTGGGKTEDCEHQTRRRAERV